MALGIYLNFKGNCSDAVKYYSKVFRLEAPYILTYGEMPGGNTNSMTEEEKKLVLHTHLNIKGTSVMFSDVPDSIPITFGDNITIVYKCKDSSEIKRIFSELKEEGKVIEELQKTFWSDLYGMVTDKYGIGWQFSLENDSTN